MPAWTCCLLWSVLPAILCADLIPRVSFRWDDSRRDFISFQQKDVFNYDTFLLSPDEDTLYVGARDAILSLNISGPGAMQLQKVIPWKARDQQRKNCILKAKSNLTECFNFIRFLDAVNQTHLYTCGTGAFRPVCAYVAIDSFTLVPPNIPIEGQGQSPFDPLHKHTGIMVDGELYTGTMDNFQGNKPIIFRTLGQRPNLKTDESLGWLHTDAAFVASFNIQHPDKPGDGKVYFFFEETAKEFDFFDKLTVSRIARVCKSDVGGDKVLQRKWTTFLKAQLLCSDPKLFPFNVIHHAVVLPGPNGSAVFYGVFTSQWQTGGSGSSAVCAFDLKDIEKVFEGNFKVLDKDVSKWITEAVRSDTHPLPGSCSMGSSDKNLAFMKSHFLMDGNVEATGKHPLLIKHNVGYTRIAIDRVRAISRQVYPVLFLGTDKGYLHKAVLVGGTSHIIEEIQLFQTPEPVQNLLLSAKGVLYVGYSAGVLQVPLANCSVYRSCFDCVLARDPYCAWDKQSQMCRDIRPSSEHRESFLQDIEAGNPNETCVNNTPKGKSFRPPSVQHPNRALVKDENITVSLNSVLHLSCPRVSAVANYTWIQDTNATSQEQWVISGETLVIIVKESMLGLYGCWASERGFMYQVARYWVMDVNGAERSSHKDLPSSPGDNIELNNKSPVDDKQSYWSPFVTVTTLLSLTLLGILTLVLCSYCEKKKSKSKVEGCSTPETAKIVNTEKQQEKTPLKSEHDLENVEHRYTNYQDNTDDSCCVPVEGAARDLENNSVSLLASNGAASRDQSSMKD